MQLATYLDLNGVSDSDFADRIGTSRQTIHRYKTGRRIPDRVTMEKISAATDGAVTPNDFFNITESPAPTGEAA